ncbi:MAG: MBL fold metallo-hydrolase [Chloroflexi bacterium]|nr:MBL fold metallo-hydrolase [Chloroflexota bacterium]
MPDHKVTVGNVELISLFDAHGDMDPLQVFPASTMDIWRNEYAEFLDADGHIHPRFGPTAVRSGGKLIVVDTGLQAPGGKFLDDMKAKGVDREAVDLVVTTHLHPDHVGWNLTNGQPTFPNARYLATRVDWDYWTQPSVLETARHITDQVLPLEGMNILDLIEGEYQITDELTTIPTPGHTPGHISIVVASAGERGMILGDVAHSPAQAHYTDWSPIFDVDGDLSRKTRHEVLDRLEADGSLVSAGHFPGTGFGRFVRQGNRRVWQVLS